MTATRRLDALRSCPAGRYEDGLVVVTAGGAPGITAGPWPGGRIAVRHSLRPGELNDDIAEPLAAALAPLADDHEVFARAFTGVVLTSRPDAGAAWEEFYRNSLARLGQARPARIIGLARLQRGLPARDQPAARHLRGRHRLRLRLPRPAPGRAGHVGHRVRHRPGHGQAAAADGRPAGPPPAGRHGGRQRPRPAGVRLGRRGDPPARPGACRGGDRGGADQRGHPDRAAPGRRRGAVRGAADPAVRPSPDHQRRPAPQARGRPPAGATRSTSITAAGWSWTARADGRAAERRG